MALAHICLSYIDMIGKFTLFLIIFFLLLSLPLGLLDLLSGGRWTLYSDVLRPRIINLWVSVWQRRGEKTSWLASWVFLIMTLPFGFVWFIWDLFVRIPTFIKDGAAKANANALRVAAKVRADLEDEFEASRLRKLDLLKEANALPPGDFTAADFPSSQIGVSYEEPELGFTRGQKEALKAKGYTRMEVGETRVWKN